MAAVLGHTVAAPTVYTPDVLEAIDRARGRSQIVEPSAHLSIGYDVWHCYELSWLLTSGDVRYATGALIIPASSPKTVESKSLKLYLNSLNAHCFPTDADAVACIEQDLSALTQSTVRLELISPERLQKSSCLVDELAPYLSADKSCERFTLVGFRSLCPVTSQPDWATLVIDVSPEHYEPVSIRSCIEELRNHQGFHEQCVEDLYSRLERALKPDLLQVVGFFQRRGGIDITPWRSSIETGPSVTRLFEQ